MLKDVFRSSKRQHASYIKLCDNLNSLYLGLNWDMPNRWNSTHHMFECAVKKKDTLKLFHDHLVDKGGLLHFWNRIGKLFQK